MLFYLMVTANQAYMGAFVSNVSGKMVSMGFLFPCVPFPGSQPHPPICVGKSLMHRRCFLELWTGLQTSQVSKAAVLDTGTFGLEILLNFCETSKGV
jgi:hypothetical protein